MSIKKTFALFIAVAALSPVFALAQGGTPPPGGGGINPPAPVKVEITLKNPFKIGNSLYAVVEYTVKNIIIPIAGILCVLAFIYSGFMYVTAGSNDTKIRKASKGLLYSAVGTAVLLGAWTIMTVIRATIDKIITP